MEAPSRGIKWTELEANHSLHYMPRLMNAAVFLFLKRPSWIAQGHICLYLRFNNWSSYPCVQRLLWILATYLRLLDRDLNIFLFEINWNSSFLVYRAKRTNRTLLRIANISQHIYKNSFFVALGLPSGYVLIVVKFIHASLNLVA